MEHFPYLFAAYSVIFATIFLYVLFLWRRQAYLEMELRSVEEQLNDLKASAASASGADAIGHER